MANQNLLSLSPKNILVRMPNWLGDLVMSTPILTDLHDRWPEAKITVMCQGGVGALLAHHPFIHASIDFKRPKGIFNQRTQKELIQPLKEGNYDLGILLTNSFSSAWWFWRGHVKNRMGYATHWRSALLNCPVPFPKERERQHLVKTYKMLLEPLGIPVSHTSPTLYVSEKEKMDVEGSLSGLGVGKNQLICGINPGAAYGSAKCWLPERFQEVARLLLNYSKDLSIIFFGDKGGTPLVNDICAGIGESERVVNLAGKTSLRELMAYIQSCHLFLTNDSGPMHIASALGIPLIALFGSTNDISTGPYQGGKVIHKHVECSPCYRRECPIDFRCMKRIEVQEVYQELTHKIHQLRK